MNGAAFQLVDAAAVPRPVFVNVLKQEPGAVTRGVIDAAGLALVNDDKVFLYAVQFQLDLAADGLCA